MRRLTRKSTQPYQHSAYILLLGVLLTCFAGSSLLGCVFAASSGDDGTTAISSFLRSYLSLVSVDSAVVPSAWRILWELCHWSVFALILGFTALGSIAIPALFCVRGFLLSYAIASFYRVFGSAGVPASFALFGGTVFISIPVLFVVGQSAFSSALELAGGVSQDAKLAARVRHYTACLPACIGLVAVGVFAQLTFIPELLKFASKHLV